MAFAALALLGSTPAGAAEKLGYEVNVNKVADANLSTAVQASSTLIELQDRPPEDVTALRARAVEDLDRLQKALRSAGYYDGQVDIKVDGQEVTRICSRRSMPMTTRRRRSCGRHHHHTRPALQDPQDRHHRRRRHQARAQSEDRCAGACRRHHRRAA